MKVIYKYDINDCIIGREMRLEKDAKVLSVKEQDGKLMAWILHETTAPQDSRFYFRGVGTGWEITKPQWPDGRFVDETSFVDTVLMPDGLVWHVFCEVTPGYYRKDFKDNSR